MPSGVETKRCADCREVKPITDFYLIHKRDFDGPRMGRCKDCDCKRRPKHDTVEKLLRTRARNRATAALIRAHRDEFDHLFEFQLSAVETEAILLEERNHANGEAGVPRLLPGKPRDGQEIEHRINRVWAEVGKCRDCNRHHHAGHACENCGALPGEVVEPLPERRGSCSCPHPARRHTPFDGCLIGDCDCTGNPLDVAS